MFDLLFIIVYSNKLYLLSYINVVQLSASFVKHLQVFNFYFRLHKIHICSLVKESTQKDVFTLDTQNHSSHRGNIYSLNN